MDLSFEYGRDNPRHELFLEAYPRARAATGFWWIAGRGSGSPTWVDRQDLEQDVMAVLWNALACYDASRGALQTFTETVVANRVASLRRMFQAERRGYGKEEPFDEAPCTLAAPDGELDSCLDVRMVLRHAAPFDRVVALSLTSYSAGETSRRLSVSRAAVYRAIARLRVAFLAAGILPRGRKKDDEKRCAPVDKRRCKPTSQVPCRQFTPEER